MVVGVFVEVECLGYVFIENIWNIWNIIGNCYILFV